MKLAKNTKVTFAELPGTDIHKYYLTKRKDSKPIELTGVTAMMRKLGLSKSYAGINPDVLARAAARGTAIHEMLQQYEMERWALGTIHYEWDCADGTHHAEDEDCNKMLNNYAKQTSADFCAVAVEYLVSDNETVASMVDLVSQVDENTVDLIDYKSSSTLDKEGVAWQLSFYKYFFEMQNKKIKVRSLIAVHCHDEKVKLVAVSYRGDDVIAEKIEAFKNGGETEDEPKESVALCTLDSLLPDYPKLAIALEQKRQLQAMIDRIDEENAEAMDALKAKMSAEHITEVAVPGGKYIFTAEHSSTRFNGKKFQADHPDMYNQYATPSSVAASLKFYKAK